MTKRIYKSGVNAVNGRPVLDHLREREEDRRLRGTENARVECVNRSKWGMHGHHFEGAPGTATIVGLIRLDDCFYHIR